MSATTDGIAFWTTEREAELRRLWDDEGLTSAYIGRLIGTSKNAVVGKAARMKLKRRPSPIRKSNDQTL